MSNPKPRPLPAAVSNHQVMTAVYHCPAHGLSCREGAAVTRNEGELHEVTFVFDCGRREIRPLKAEKK